MKLTNVTDEKINEFLEVLVGETAKEIKRNPDNDSIECLFTTETISDSNEEISVTETVSFDKYTLRNSQRPVTASDIKLHKLWLAANWCHPWFDDNPLFDANPFINY